MGWHDLVDEAQDNHIKQCRSLANTIGNVKHRATSHASNVASLPLARARIRGGTHEQLHWRRGFALGYVAGYVVGIIATVLALR